MGGVNKLYVYDCIRVLVIYSIVLADILDIVLVATLMVVVSICMCDCACVCTRVYIPV